MLFTSRALCNFQLSATALRIPAEELYTEQILRDELGHWIGFLLNVSGIANEFYQSGDTNRLRLPSRLEKKV